MSLRFEVFEPKGWTKEQCEEFLITYFKDEDIENCFDTWNGTEEFDGNVFDSEEFGEGTYPYGLVVYSVTNGRTDTISEPVASCSLRISS